MKTTKYFTILIQIHSLNSSHPGPRGLLGYVQESGRPECPGREVCLSSTWTSDAADSVFLGAHLCVRRQMHGIPCIFIQCTEGL